MKKKINNCIANSIVYYREIIDEYEGKIFMKQKDSESKANLVNKHKSVDLESKSRLGML